MKNLKKFIIFFVVFTIAFLSFFIFSGEFFFNYALSRKQDSKKIIRNIPSEVKQDNLNIIKNNKKLEVEKTTNWICNVNKDVLSIKSNDGLTLKASKFFHDRYTDKYAVIIHGYTDKKEDFYDIARHYYEKGFNVIAPDLRAHGESEGRYIGMGWLDKDDVKLWIDYIKRCDNKSSIILHGVSMGAATVMMTSGDNLLNNVKLVIEDCGYTSVKDIFKSELQARFKLPEFPLIQALSLVTMLRANYSINEASCLDQVAKSKVPILVIHGDRDNFVPVYMAYQIYNKIKSDKDIFIINGAGHAECRFLETDMYYRKVFDFIKSRI